MHDLIKSQMVINMMESVIATRKKHLKVLKFLNWTQLFLSAWMIALGISLITKNPGLATIDFALGIFNGFMHIKGRKDITTYVASIAEAEQELETLRKDV